VASGQKIPEIGVNVEGGGEGGEGEGAGATEDADDKSKILSRPSETAESEAGSIAGTAGTAAPDAAEADIADRAAAMLEGLQSGATLNKDGSLSVRRRRESADTERQRRRNRRQQATSAKGEDGGLMSPTAIPEEGTDADGGASVITVDEEQGPSTPVTVVHPPSPEQKGRDLPTPPPE